MGEKDTSWHAKPTITPAQLSVYEPVTRLLKLTISRVNPMQREPRCHGHIACFHFIARHYQQTVHTKQSVENMQIVLERPLNSRFRLGSYENNPNCSSVYLLGRSCIRQTFQITCTPNDSFKYHLFPKYHSSTLRKNKYRSSTQERINGISLLNKVNPKQEFI